VAVQKLLKACGENGCASSVIIDGLEHQPTSEDNNGSLSGYEKNLAGWLILCKYHCKYGGVNAGKILYVGKPRYEL